MGLLLQACPLLPSAASAANGPSFDCSRAVSKREKAVCADPRLSTLDRSVANAYAQSLARVPTAWKKPLRDSERTWIAYLNGICLAGDNDMDAGGYSGCLVGAYRDRIEELQKTLVSVGHVRFVSLTRYAVRRAASHGGADSGKPHSIRKTIRLLQIAEPSGAGERRWNVMIRRRLRELTAGRGYGDEQGMVTVNSVGDGFIQATLSHIDEGVGPGVGAVTTVSLPWLIAARRLLKASDLFAAPRRVDEILVKLAAPRLKKKAKGFDDTFDLTADQVKSLVEPVRYWTLTRAGIRISPDTENGINQSMLTAVELSIELPWGELRPYLRKHPTLDIKTLHDAPG